MGVLSARKSASCPSSSLLPSTKRFRGRARVLDLIHVSSSQPQFPLQNVRVRTLTCQRWRIRWNPPGHDPCHMTDAQPVRVCTPPPRKCAPPKPLSPPALALNAHGLPYITQDRYLQALLSLTLVLPISVLPHPVSCPKDITGPSGVPEPGERPPAVARFGSPRF